MPFRRTLNSIAIPPSTTSASGYLTFTDWNTFNNKENVLSFDLPFRRTLNSIAIPPATDISSGYLTFIDWKTFNNKVTSITGPPVNTSPLYVNNTNPQNPIVSFNTDWDTFSNKVSSITGPALDTSPLYVDNTDVKNPIVTFNYDTSLFLMDRVSDGNPYRFTMFRASSIKFGYLTSTDWSRFNNKENGLTFSSPLVRGTSMTNDENVITIQQATDISSGYLTFTDWTTFNSKENGLTFDLPFIRTLNSIAIPPATDISSGYLSFTDWNTFNNKASLNGANIWSGTNRFDSSVTFSTGQSVYNNGAVYYNALPSTVESNILSHNLSTGRLNSITPSQFYTAYPPPGSSSITVSTPLVRTGDNIAIPYLKISTDTPSITYNEYMGFGAGGVGTGNYNVCIGRRTGALLTTGSSNTLLGYNSGSNLTTGSDNIIINTNPGINTGTNNIILGATNTTTTTALSYARVYGYNNAMNHDYINIFGDGITSQAANSSYMSNIRNVTNTMMLSYNTATKEITYESKPTSGIKFTKSASAPSGAVNGDEWYNNYKIYKYIDGNWLYMNTLSYQYTFIYDERTDKALTIPASINNICRIRIMGAGGGQGVYSFNSGSSGAGGFTVYHFNTTNYINQQLKFIVGQGGEGGYSAVRAGAGGYPNGGNGISGDTYPGGGGGRSDVRIGTSSNTFNQSTILAIAGGGGGGSGYSYGGSGGAGGGTNGQSNTTASSTGGTQSSGGTSSTNSFSPPSQFTQAGSLQGAGGIGIITANNYDTGGGGDGYYGGGCGGGDGSSSSGGSGYINTSFSGYVSYYSISSGTYSGNYMSVPAESTSYSEFTDGCGIGVTGIGNGSNIVGVRGGNGKIVIDFL